MADRHFFVSSAAHWNTGVDLAEVIKRQERDDKATWKSRGMGSGVDIWEVPLPPEAPYKINGYAPQVEGAKLVTSFQYKWMKRK